jgi:RNA polymerase sigma-70 factor (ECF subfamily)
MSLDAWLDDAVRQGRAAWPDFVVDEAELRAHLRKRAESLPDPAGVASLRVTDLYLAFACLRRDARALAAFEGAHAPLLERLLRRLDVTDAEAADLQAEIREMLFFGRDGAEPIANDYSGRGDLGAWLRAIAVRLAYKTKRKAGRHVDADDALSGLASEANPELSYLRQSHRAAFEQVLAQALAELSPRERNLLRQHYIDGLGLDALGRLYNVHRATAARWIAEARKRVLDAVTSKLATMMSPSELASLLRLTKRDLGLQISVILRGAPPG